MTLAQSLVRALTFVTEREHETVVRLLREYKERLVGVILSLNVHMRAHRAATDTPRYVLTPLPFDQE
jgi:hypothetical protein